MWFQNARAKYRRSLQRGDKAGGEGQRLTTSSSAVPAPLHHQSSSSTSSELEMDTRLSCCNTGTSTSSASSSSISSDLQLTVGNSSHWSTTLAFVIRWQWQSSSARLLTLYSCSEQLHCSSHSLTAEKFSHFSSWMARTFVITDGGNGIHLVRQAQVQGQSWRLALIPTKLPPKDHNPQTRHKQFRNWLKFAYDCLPI